MRITVVNWTRRAAGGAEIIMAAGLDGMARAGHDLAFWHEIAGPTDRPLLKLPEGPTWCAEELGRDPALDRIRDWKPDVLYVHGLLDPSIEEELLTVAPGVFLAESYYGTCISGYKTFTAPRVRPCPNRFDWRCLLRYYPRRTGGLNPVSMVRAYRRQARRLALLRDYRFLLVLSSHMRSEYLQHGFSPNRVICLPFAPLVHRPQPPPPPQSLRIGQPLRLLFVGRMDPLKGGAQLLRSVVGVIRSMAVQVELTMVGDGPSRESWRAMARRLSNHEPSLSVQFPGWISGDRLPDYFRAADLLVMPSLWPEPFGRTGLEAAAFGVPAVAFATGGITDWLRDGVNGHLAPGDPPRVSELSAAIVRALQDAPHYQALSRGALEVASRLDGEHHVRVVLDTLQRAAVRGTG